MRVSTMRRADRWLGAPACFVLTMVRKLVDRPSSAIAAPHRILFIKLAEQGSTVLASQAIRRAVSKVGAGNVYFLAFEENRHILDAMALIPEHNVVTIRTSSLAEAVTTAGRAIGRLRRERIDTAIDLEFFARSSAALSYLSGATSRVGFHPYAGEASYRGDLLTHRLSFNPQLHASQTFETLVAALDQPPATLPAVDFRSRLEDQVPAQFVPRGEEIEQMRRLLDETAGGRADARMILLNANASDLVPLRRWPIERYVQLAQQLLARYSTLIVVFTGAPQEAESAGRLVTAVGSERAISLAGQTTVRQLLVLYGLADVLVTNDSGPAHFGALTSIDVVTLFGPETPALFRALTPRSHVVWAGIACSPCVNAYNDRRSACPNNLCMQQITVDDVFERVCRIYESRQARLSR
jgi:ADP-heptose:LPS heptosyltransferase